MKTLKTALAVFLSVLFFSACGGIPSDYSLDVDWPDDDEETTDGSGGTSSDEEGDDDSQSGRRRSGDTEYADGNDTSGGIEWWNLEEQRPGPRTFMGTYMFLESVYYNGSYDNVCDYGFPLHLRLFSHGDTIDLESSTGRLFGIADLYGDETFDFEVGFLDKFGNPSLTLVCTCYIDEGYGYYNKDKIKCGCEPSNDDDNCAAFYEKLE